jgi:hypothetical protein
LDKPIGKTDDEKTEANRSRLLALWNYKGFFPDGSKAADATVDGSVYDREYIEQWIRSCRQQRQPITSPLTGLVRFVFRLHVITYI